MEIKYTTRSSAPHGALRDAPKYTIVAIAEEQEPVPFLLLGSSEDHALLLSLQSGNTLEPPLNANYWELDAELLIKGIKR